MTKHNNGKWHLLRFNNEKIGRDQPIGFAKPPRQVTRLENVIGTPKGALIIPTRGGSRIVYPSQHGYTNLDL